MTLERTELFTAWLNTKLSETGLTDSELAKRANMSHSVLSKARRGILPKYEACAKIAYALRVHPIEVFQIAGLIPTLQNLDTDFEELKHLYDSFPKKKRKIVIKFAKWVAEEDL
jgi:predicted transcriptional regulator